MNTTLKLLCCLAAFAPFASSAQDDIPDEPWQQRDRANAKPIAYGPVREADVMWSQKVWRTIDLRQKMNLPFAYPQRPLIQILHQAASVGAIRAFDPTVEHADQFVKLMDTATVAHIGVKDDTVEVLDPLTLLSRPTIIHNTLSWDRITKFKVKEVWYFDTKTASMQVRIIGIAPVMEDYDANGNYRGDMTMYWLYYPDLRDMLAREEVADPGNDKRSLSWDDIFAQRRFESSIYRESNVYDRAIAEYASGKDIQLESDRIRQKNFEYEHDLWDY